MYSLTLLFNYIDNGLIEMEKNNIIRKLKTHGVNEDDMIIFLLKLRDKSFNIKDCDVLLHKLGYLKLFNTRTKETTINNESYDEKLINNFIYKRNLENNIF
jgi:hypothetical protein